MRPVVYVDVLFFVNLIVNYFILLGTRRAVGADGSRWRMVGGAALGALYSMIIFFPNLPWFLTLLTKLIFAASIVTAAFGFVERKRFLRLLAWFFTLSFAFAGIMIALWYVASPPGMAVHNGVVYVNLPPLALILSSAAAYVIFGFIQRFFGTRRKNTMCKVTISVGEKSVTVDALIDTGHALKETFSGSPVIICEYSAVQPLIPPPLHRLFSEQPGEGETDRLKENPDWARRYRMIPCTTIAGTGILPAFKADATEVSVEGKREKIGAYIAVSKTSLSGGEYHALLSPEAV